MGKKKKLEASQQETKFVPLYEDQSDQTDDQDEEQYLEALENDFNDNVVNLKYKLGLYLMEKGLPSIRSSVKERKDFYALFRPYQEKDV
jgi:hypothetical protein